MAAGSRRPPHRVPTCSARCAGTPSRSPASSTAASRPGAASGSRRAAERLVAIRARRPRTSWLQAWIGLVHDAGRRRCGTTNRGACARRCASLIARENFDAILIHAIRTGAARARRAAPARRCCSKATRSAPCSRARSRTRRVEASGLHWERWRADRFLVECTRRVVGRRGCCRHAGSRLPHGASAPSASRRSRTASTSRCLRSSQRPRGARA